MIRTIALISCLIAALFYVPIQGECSETPEYESETEIECCVAASSSSQSQVAESLPKILPMSDSSRHNMSVSVKAQKPYFNQPVRILSCVFRE